MQNWSNDLENNKICGEDLCTLARLLSNYSICHDTGSLDNAGEVFNKTATDITWGYKIGSLNFKIDEVGKRRPAEATDLNLQFSIDISGIYYNEDLLKDPLTSLNFDLELFGRYCDSNQNDVSDIHAAWHLDPQDYDEMGTDYCHPHYHLTFGGHKLEEKDIYFGNILILPSPRIAHPPMDAVLGIDFIIQNYFNKQRIVKLLDDPIYRNIVRKSQEYLWKPYYAAIASKWVAPVLNIDPNLDFQRLLPFLTKD